MKLSRLALCLLFLAQFALFRQFAVREIIGNYPADFDQATYLNLGYTLYQDGLRQGPFAAVGNYLREPHPTGWMLPLQDAVMQWFLGPGRLPALYLNFAYLLLLQTVLFGTVRWLTGRLSLAWVAVGLLLSQVTAFLPAGGMFDCRIDFDVYCLYGIFVCLVVRSNALRVKRWLWAAAACALLLFSFRFITFAYDLGFCATLFTALLAVRFFRPGRPRDVLLLRVALGRTAIFGLGCAFIGGVVIALNWQAIHDYYVVGHLTGNEKHIRALESGISSLSGHLTFYGWALWKKHLGSWFVVLWLGVGALGIAQGLCWARRASRPGIGGGAPTDPTFLIQLLVVAASLFAPWFILTLDEAKSALVANVFTVPVVLLLFVALAGAFPHRLSAARPPARAAFDVWPILAALTMMLGVGNWINRLARESRRLESSASIAEANKLHQLLGDQAQRFGLASPRLMADVIVDWAMPVTIEDSLLEHGGRWIDFNSSLRVTLFEVSRDEVFAGLKKSDFVLLTDFPKIGAYPFLESMRAYAPEMREWCEKHLLHVRDFSIRGGQVSLYTRVEPLHLEGVAGGWLAPSGVQWRLPRETLAWMRKKGRTTLVMEGARNRWLPGLPQAHSALKTMDGWPVLQECPARFAFPDENRYRLTVNFDQLLGISSAPADFSVSVSLEGSSFVPKEAGINGDERRLVVTAPDAVFFE